MKGNRVIDLESLCIEKGEKVWDLQLHLTLLNNAGNLPEAMHLGTILSLLSFTFPPLEGSSSRRPLGLYHLPFLISYLFLDGSSILVRDPLKEEESISEGKILVAVNGYGEICYVHKPGGGHVDQEVFMGIVENARKEGKKMGLAVKELFKNRMDVEIDLGDWDACF